MEMGAFTKQSIVRIAGTLGEVFRSMGHVPDVEAAVRAAKSVVDVRSVDPLSSWYKLLPSERVMATSVLAMLIVQAWLGRRITVQTVETMMVVLPGSNQTATELRGFAQEMRSWS